MSSIQDILADTDSSSEEEPQATTTTLAPLSSYRRARNHHHHHPTTTTTTTTIDLEQILREDEDGNDDVDDDDLDHDVDFENEKRLRSMYEHRDDDDEINDPAAPTTVITTTTMISPLSSGNGVVTQVNKGLHSSPLPHSHWQLPQQSRQHPFADDATSLKSSEAESFSSVRSHNAEDWAVLQAILQEDDDDDEEDDDDNNPNEWLLESATTMTAQNTRRRSGRGTSHTLLAQERLRVDALLRSEDEDDDEDIMGGGDDRALSEAVSNFSNASPPLHSFPTTMNATQYYSPSMTSPNRVNALNAANLSSPPRPFSYTHPSTANAVPATFIQPPTSAVSESKPDKPTSTSNIIHPLPPLSPPRPAYQPFGAAVNPTPPTSWQHNQQTKQPHSASQEQQNNFLDDQVDESQYQNISRSKMSHALTAERKLLKAGHRDIMSPLTVKRRLRPKIEVSARINPNNTRQHQQQRQYDQRRKTLADHRLTSVPTPRFGFSGIVENRPMNDVSNSICKHIEKDAKVACGLPTCLAFNSRFIAVGTQLAIILVFDLFEVLRQRLGAPPIDDAYTAKKLGSITSLDLSYNGEVIVAGYTSGALLLWDTIKGVILRAVVDAHPSPITSVRFLTELKMVTVDAGGLVNKLTFTRNILWSNYSMETECLLDGTAGQILAMNVLSPFLHVNPLVRPEALSSVLGRLTLIALSSERSSFVVAVDPRVSVLHRWARPTADRMEPLEDHSSDLTDQAYLPCLTWGWALVSGGNNLVMPILARAWGCCLQLLCSSFPTLEDGMEPAAAATAAAGGEQVMHWPAFGQHEEMDTIAPVVALEWLNDRSIVYLTVTNECTLVDTVMMTMLERLDFSGLKLVYAEFTLSRTMMSQPPATLSPSSSSVEGDKNDALEQASPQPISCTTFQNSIRSSDDRVMVLCREELRCISIVGAKRRISSLEEDGEWLEALALALDHYESAIVSQEDRRRDPSGRKDLSRHPEFSIAKGEDEEWIAKLLIRYINLAFDNAPESSVDSSPGSPTRIDLAQSHFQMLAGVCVEFCVVTRRLDLLFGPIFRRFQEVRYTSVFLDVLEPYVLTDKLSYISPEVMAHFVEHCKATNGIATVERCLLHMDCTIMDFDSILSLLRTNEMYSALFYVFNRGLDDFVTPLEVLLGKVFDEADAGGATRAKRGDGSLQTSFERHGYKAILYLQTCFKGKTFPHEKNILPDERQQTVKLELLSFLLKEKFVPSSHFKSPGESSAVIGLRALMYPYMRLLLLVDPIMVLETMTIVLNPEERNAVSDATGLTGGDCVDGDARLPETQKVVDVVSSIALPKPGSIESTVVQSPYLLKSFLDFTGDYLIDGLARVEKDVVIMIVKRMADRFVAANTLDSRRSAQKKIMDLLSALPRGSYDPDTVLEVIQQAEIHRAALLLHQQVASSWYDDSANDMELRSRHFRCAIDCFIGDDDEQFRRDVFDYVKRECSGINSTPAKQGKNPLTMRNSVFDKLPALVHLDALMTARLVAEVFVNDLDRVVKALEKDEDGEALFKFFQTIDSGELLQIDPVAGTVLNLTMDHHHEYLALMAKLHPDMVYDYLATHDNYRPEECLKLCQQYEIADASAYLLERLGNVSSALQLILQTLESRLMQLKRTIRGMGVDVFRQISARHSVQKSHKLSMEFLGSQVQDVERVKRILIVALDLCERNSGTASTRSEHGSQLWFNVLDRLINSKGFLRLSKEQPEHATVVGGVLSELLQLTMQRMVSSVPLSDLVRKVTSDHSGSRLGELREMIESLLSTYGHELQVFAGAMNVFQQDAFNMQQERRKLQIEAASVNAVEQIPLSDDNSADPRQTLFRLARFDKALQIGGGSRNAHIIEAESMSYSKHVETGLRAAMDRLRARRGDDSLREFTNISSGKNTRTGGLNMMTVTEHLYMAGESDPVVYGSRPIGALGTAEHRGRLMTFG